MDFTAKDVGIIAYGENSRVKTTTTTTNVNDRNPVEQGTAPKAKRKRSVFVVYGRDDQARAAMFGFLRALHLEPKEWPQLLAESGEAAPFTGKVVSEALSRARAAVVLLTPDDVVCLHESLRMPGDPAHETRPQGQPRPNVLIELGMALATYPQRTLLVEVGPLRPVSDLVGRYMIRLDGGEEPLRRLAQCLKEAGCDVDDRGRDWLDPRRFADLAAYARRPPDDVRDG